MHSKTRVLVFPAGGINSVELHDALCANVNIEVYGASSVERHGAYLYKNYISGLPMITDPHFPSVFNHLLEEKEIDFVFPTHDTIALYLAENKKLFSSGIIAADARTAHICRDKKATYELFSGEFFCPQVQDSAKCFPCFIKPRDGQGAVGTKLLYTAKDIPTDIKWDDYVVTEYLPGEELTVDCLTDKDGVLRTILPRSRDRLLAGVCVAGTAVSPTQEIISIAQRINAQLGFLGLWYFQIKKDTQGYYKLLEISTRCAGTMCLSRARGVNLPLLSVYAALGRDVSVFKNECPVKVDRTLISRYHLDYEYHTVYLDYDDTLIVNGKVCLPVIRFLYQCKNAHVRVILLTRHNLEHETAIHDDLKHFSIAETLFTEIINLTANEEKAALIQPDQAVFVDNAYVERKKVHDRLSIPVFDVEGIEVLTDWRS